MYNILICDDEQDIRAALRIYLSQEIYHIIEAENGRQAVEIAQTTELHLALMDIMMPEMDGLQAMEIIRITHNFPILLLTAKSEDHDKIAGLNLGADDYITKPFNPLEVQARVRSHLRRYTNLGGMSKPKPSTLTVGSIELDDEQKLVSVDGEPVALTPMEYDILKLLMESPGRVYSSAQIYSIVCNENGFGSESAVAVHIRHLREKIEINPSEPRYLKVVWGRGYKMERV
ncbi:MAG: response regulator transcription factor [Clostridia bacterium]|nr:response regulator transcription factor [Clostridia bacterium]